MKRRALSDSALNDDWSFDNSVLVSDMVNRTAMNPDSVPQKDMSLNYATTDQLERQNENIGVLASSPPLHHTYENRVRQHRHTKDRNCDIRAQFPGMTVRNAIQNAVFYF